jgi:protein involved in polysaccharide export with SLBB domain
MPRRPIRFVWLAIGSASALAACAQPSPRPTAEFTNIGYATWQDDEPDYRLYAGDVLDVAAGSAPELNRTVTVQPDGRITLPLIQPVMAADRSPGELQQALAQAYASQLVRPAFEVNVKTAVPLKVFVGGEVDKPGVYDMPGDIDALQAVTMAGGFRTSAQPRKVVVIRRGPGGRPMMRTVDLSRATFDPAHGEALPLRRFDVIFVPRSGIAQVGLFVQQYLRDTLPVQFSYALNGQYVSTR